MVILDGSRARLVFVCDATCIGVIRRGSYIIDVSAGADFACRRRFASSALSVEYPGAPQLGCEISGVGPAFCPIILCKLKLIAGHRGSARRGRGLGVDAKTKGLQSLMVGRVLRIVLALVLVAVLAVLYVLSQGGDLQRQTQISSDLRNLKDIDTFWNRDVEAARGDPSAPEPPPLSLDSRLEPLLTDLESETIGLKNVTLSSGVE